MSPWDIVKVDQQIYLLEGANAFISGESKKFSREAFGSPTANFIYRAYKPVISKVTFSTRGGSFPALFLG